MTPLSLLCLLLAIYATSCSASQFTDRGVDGALELSDDNIQDGQLFGKLKRARNPYSWMLNEAKRARNPYSWMARQKEKRSFSDELYRQPRNPYSWMYTMFEKRARNPYSWMNE